MDSRNLDPQQLDRTGALILAAAIGYTIGLHAFAVVGLLHVAGVL